MTRVVTVPLAAAALMAATAAQAQGADEEYGFYAGAGVGEYQVEIDDFDDVTTTIEEYDSDDTAWKAFGGWRANRYFSTEIAYINLGSPTDEIAPDVFAKTETDGFAPYVVGTFPLGPFELFAKAGYYIYETDARVTTPLGTATGSDSGDDFTWTAGAGVTIFDTFNLRLEYEQFDFENTDDSTALWLTGAFRF
ncbi:MAG TPA: outer membrane beta-barrel protein [Steroidobacteraceae bacterium]